MRSVTQAMAEQKLEAAFDFFTRLGAPYFTFHDADVMAAIMAGACGYLLKDASIDSLVDGVRAAANGESLADIAAPLGRRKGDPAFQIYLSIGQSF